MPSWLHKVTEKVTDHISVNVTKRTSIIFILIFTVVAVVDSTIAEFATYGDTEFTTSLNLVIFTLFYLAFAIIGIILLNSVRKNILKSTQRLALTMKPYQAIILAVQILMMIIILTIILQIILIHVYDLRLVYSSTILTHLSVLTFMAVLVIMFISWLRSRRNYTTLLYLMSFFLISVSVIVSLIYLEYQFSFSNSLYRKEYPIHNYVIRQEIRPLSESLATTFDIMYLLSFFAIWIATAALLSQYRHKLGKIKYYTLIGIPMIYYLFTFEGYFGNAFSQLVLHYPVTYGVTYTLVFSATKQIGALLFSLAFLATSSLVRNERVIKSMLISSIGIAMLFGSIEIATLQYRLYPPYGIVTEAFMPLGAYLLLVGIFTSATSVARDAKLRNEFYKSAMSQFALLKTIGFTQMEKELMKNFQTIEKRTSKIEETQEHYSEENVRLIVREVLEELKRKDLDKTKG